MIRDCITLHGVGQAVDVILVEPPVSRQEYEEALVIAEEVIHWAEEGLQDR